MPSRQKAGYTFLLSSWQGDDRGHDQLFDALVRPGLLELSRLVDWVWLPRRLAASQTPPTPATSIPKRAQASTPCVGLIHTPHGDACEHAIARHPQAPSSRPPRLMCTRGRQRTIDTPPQCGPDHACTDDGWVGRGNIRAHGHPGGKPWRQLQCVACQRYCQEPHGTVLHAQRVAPQMWVWAVGARAEGLGIRAVARVFAVAPNTVLPWLVEAADQLQAFSRDVLHDLRVTPVQLDELSALVRAVKVGQVGDGKAIERLSRSPQGVWGAIDPVTKLLLTIDVGDRMLATAQRVVHQVVQVLAPDCRPLLITDGFQESVTALLTHVGHWVQPSRRQAKGRPQSPAGCRCLSYSRPYTMEEEKRGNIRVE